MTDLDQHIADLKEEIKECEARLEKAVAEEKLELLETIRELNKTLLELMDQKSKSQSDVKAVKICIGDKVQDAVITFQSTKRPFETVTEEVLRLELLEYGMSFDSFRLVTTKNAVVTDYASIAGEPSLIFHSPEKITPLSGIEWTNTQLDQLGVKFEDVDMNTFFSNAGLLNFKMSARGVILAKQLNDVDGTLHQKYIPEEDGNEHASAAAIRANPLLQHPICKALFAATTYVKVEPFFDDFVRYLLNEMGFNDGSLYAAPKMPISLFFGDTEKMAMADVTIIDLLSDAKLLVVEDKNRDGMIWNSDSTAQLVAAAIAITQRNGSIGGVKRDADGNRKSESDLSVKSASRETIYGIRVHGYKFYFYAFQVSAHMHLAMRTQNTALYPTTVNCYESEAGLNFMTKKERNEIILMLSLLQEVASRPGETSYHRN